MNKLSYLPIWIFVIVGLIVLSSFWWGRESFEISYRLKNGVDSISAADLRTRKNYDLFIDGYELPERNNMSWRIITPAPENDTIFDFIPVKVYAFERSGIYRVEAYRDLKLVGSADLTVKEGAFASIDIGNDGNRIELGNSLEAGIKSGGGILLEEPTWKVLRDGQEVYEIKSDSLIWKPEEPGNYDLSLSVEMEGVQLEDFQSLSVYEKPKPKKVVAKPEPRQPNAAELARERERQEKLDKDRRAAELARERERQEKLDRDRRAAELADLKEKERLASLKTENKETEPTTSGWIPNFKGNSSFALGPSSPARSEVQFKEGTTVILLKPKTNINIKSFQYFGNSKNGNYNITFECLTCSSSREKQLGPYTFTVTRDDYNSVVQSLATRPLGFVKDHEYRVTISTTKGVEMGFQNLSQRKFSNSDIAELEFQGGTSQVFNIVFEKK